MAPRSQTESPKKSRKPGGTYQLGQNDVATAIDRCQRILRNLSPAMRKIAGQALHEWSQVEEVDPQRQLPLDGDDTA